MADRILIGTHSVPRFRAHVDFRFDERRSRWVILAPERMWLPDEVAVDVLRRCDGELSVGEIAEALATRYDARRARVARDVTQLLQELSDGGVICA